MNDLNKNLPPEFSTEELKMPEGTVSPIDEQHHGKLAIILGLFIIVLITILVGLYLWFLNIEQTNTTPPQIIREVPEMPNDPETANAEASVQQLETLSPSNSIDAIEADLESTNLDQLDTELQAIDAELGVQAGNEPETTTETEPVPEENTDESTETTQAEEEPIEDDAQAEVETETETTIGQSTTTETTIE